MKKLKLLLVLALVSNSVCSYAQITYEKGYIIDDKGTKIDCYIKNGDWKNNPKAFLYKISENAESRKADLNNTSEVAIGTTLKYVRFQVEIDTSSDNLDNIENLSFNKNPTLVTKQLFLKVSIEGKANLYQYEQEWLNRFFFTTDSIKITQLIFKNYLVEGNSIAQNNTFRQQLSNYLSCRNISKSVFENIGYKENELIKFFSSYNECSHSATTNYFQKSAQGAFHLSIRPGLNLGHLKTKNYAYDNPVLKDFGNKPDFRIGLEAAFVLPFNKNKWTLIFEPAFQTYKSNIENEVTFADLKLFELPLGIRHSFFLKNKSQFFIDALFLENFMIHSKSNIGAGGALVDFGQSASFALGAGYQIKQFAFECRYEMPRNILDNYVFLFSDYSGISFIVGYKLF